MPCHPCVVTYPEILGINAQAKINIACHYLYAKNKMQFSVFWLIIEMMVDSFTVSDYLIFQQLTKASFREDVLCCIDHTTTLVIFCEVILFSQSGQCYQLNRWEKWEVEKIKNSSTVFFFLLLCACFLHVVSSHVWSRFI